jgi:hypothetical protein
LVASKAKADGSLYFPKRRAPQVVAGKFWTGRCVRRGYRMVVVVTAIGRERKTKKHHLSCRIEIDLHIAIASSITIDN